MKFTPTAIADVVVIDPVVFEDARGYFMDTWQVKKYREAGIDAAFVQHSQSRSARGTLRGLHYQVNEPQGKLIRVLQGEAFDVAVDLRRSSPTFGGWVAETLSAGNRRLIWVPPGFAHGFYVLSDYAEFQYCLTGHYAPQQERTIAWNDPDIGIEWPIGARDKPLLSDKYRRGVPFREAETYA